MKLKVLFLIYLNIISSKNLENEPVAVNVMSNDTEVSRASYWNSLKTKAIIGIGTFSSILIVGGVVATVLLSGHTSNKGSTTTTQVPFSTIDPDSSDSDPFLQNNSYNWNLAKINVNDVNSAKDFFLQVNNKYSKELAISCNKQLLSFKDSTFEYCAPSFYLINHDSNYDDSSTFDINATSPSGKIKKYLLVKLNSQDMFGIHFTQSYLGNDIIPVLYRPFENGFYGGDAYTKCMFNLPRFLKDFKNINDTIIKVGLNYMVYFKGSYSITFNQWEGSFRQKDIGYRAGNTIFKTGSKTEVRDSNGLTLGVYYI